MLVLSMVLLLCVLTIITLTYLLGFRLGGHSWIGEIQRVHAAEAIAAERQIHDLTRQAFVAMVEHVQRRRQDRNH